MTNPSEVIDLMSAEGRDDEGLVIELASPEQPDGLYRQDLVEVDSNNFCPQFQGQNGNEQDTDAQACSRLHAVRAAQKRLWEGPAGVEEQQRHLARRMQWGSTGPRMQRNRGLVPEQQQELHQPASAATAAALDPSSFPRLPAVSGRRRLSVVPRRQAPAAATGHRRGEPATVVIDDDSPSPHAIRQQQHGGRSAGAAAAATRPAPTAIQGNPRYAYRSSGAATASQQEWQLSRGRLMRSPSGHRSSGSMAVIEGHDNSNPGSRNSSSSSDAEFARKAQEEEDAQLALRLMQEEEQQAQRVAAERNRRRMELLQQLEAEEAAAAAAATAAAASEAMGSRARGRRGGRMPQRAEDLQHVHQQSPHWGMAMAHALLQLPRWGAGAPSRSRGLPPGLSAMREAVLGMQAAGLPLHLLFSDRDFNADDYEMLLRLDETVEKKGAKMSTIESLPTQTVPAGGITGTAGEKLSCAVCLEEYAEGAELRTLPCLHKFHKGCIDKWLGMKASCPVCNRECV